MDRLRTDLRFAVRVAIKNPAFTALAVLTLGLGIGANTAIFSAINGVLLRPLPYAHGERLVLVRQSAPLAGRANVGVSVPEFYAYRDQAKSFDRLVEYHQMNFDLLKRGEPDRVSVGVVSHDFFDVLGVKPLFGRSFAAEDDRPGAEAVLVISYAYWKTKFGGDTAIVGQQFDMNDRPHRVVGVLPNIPQYPQENDVYMPVSACPFRAAAERLVHQNPRVFSILTVFGRLADATGQTSAAAEVDTICRRTAQQNTVAYPRGFGFTATTLSVQNELTRNARPMLLVLVATTGLVLLIACANVATLTLSRLLRRDRELAVRTAMGAERATLIRQLVTESLLLSFAGAAVGLLFASATQSMLTSFVARFTTRTADIGIDPWVLGFTLLMSIATGVASGVSPALTSRVNLASAMKQSGRGATEGPARRRAQHALVVFQVAISVVLLVGAGLLLVSFYRLQQVQPGFRADHVLSAETFTNFTKYPQVDAQMRFYEPVLKRLQAEPGVVSAAITNAVPLSALQPNATPFLIEGRAVDDPSRRPSADARVISPDYFRTLDIPLVTGRPFSDHDAKDATPVVIVNQAMTRYWDGANPVGARVSFDGGQTWATVVGVVGDVKQFGLDRDSIAQVYLPLAQSQGLQARFLIRTVGNPIDAARIFREDVHAVDPAMPVKNVQTLDDIRDLYLATPRLTALLLTVFSCLALLVTITGLAGLISTSVSQRIPEFGVRLALGATPGTLLRLVLGQGLRLVAIGLLAGVVAASILTKVLSSYLFATRPTDPLTFGAVAVTFLVAGTVASLAPAWRATRIAPAEALRAD